MPSDCISFQESGYFSKIIIDYLNQEPALQDLYNHFPTIENFKLQIEEKQQFFSQDQRIILKNALLDQYKNVDASFATQNNIQALEESQTFTVTTGHQLNLFTGPLYFLYKIIATINLCKKLQNAYPQQKFVPIYWMATEDHDFDEINYFILHGKKIRWNRASQGAVGQLSTEGLQEISTIFDQEIGAGKNAQYLKELFQKAYLEHNNLTDATRFLANELFKDSGLVIVDGDHQTLKKQLIPACKMEIENQMSFYAVKQNIDKLGNYNIQVNPREINLFYMEKNLRERIIEENGIYKINNTSISFSKEEILKLIDQHPEKFSPNVIIRPLYQELILPNLCYIGGGGEIAYWLELKNYFDQMHVPFPILLLRNSAVIIEEKQLKKIANQNSSIKDLFKKQQELIDQKAMELSSKSFDFVKQKAFLNDQFQQLQAIVATTDPSFAGAVKAQEVKQIKGLENLEKRFLKAEKKKFKDDLDRLIELQNEIFPNQSLQERQTNFSEFYAKYGSQMIQKMLQEIQPLDSEFNIIIL